MTNNKKHILFGVTGSVAAVKAPEIALRLVVEQGLTVKILLTKGGRHFWDQSHTYNSEIWRRFEECLKQESEKKEPCLSIIGTFQSWLPLIDWRRGFESNHVNRDARIFFFIKTKQTRQTNGGNGKP